MTDWPYKYFTRSEMACKHTGKCEMDPDFMRSLDALREAFQQAMPVTSGYRHPSHPREIKKATPGTHAQGIAADIGVAGADAFRLVKLAMEMGFTGIGVSQAPGGSRFVHLDKRTTGVMLWSY